MSKLFHVKSPGPSGSGIHAFIAIPTYTGQVQGPCLYSLLGALPVLQREGISYDVLVMAGNCHVDDARNGCVREFLKTDCTDLFFLDADVGFDPEAIAKILKLDRDLVAGVYPKKHDEEDFPVTVAGGVELWADSDGLVEVEGAPTGFMRIRRNVLEAMVEKYKHRRYSGQGDGPGDPPYTIIFERTYEAGRRFSGDYAFCRKWREMGGKVFVDPELPFTHEGLKEWGGVLGDFWRKKYGVTQSRYEEAISRLRQGDDAPELFVWLYQGWGNTWAATPSMLASAYHLARSSDGTILECGSGLTTIVLALATESIGTNVVSLESDSGWMARITHELTKHGLRADVRYAPITEYEGFKWYRAPEPSSYALVVCDGPQRQYGRRGLFELLGEQIADAVIVMDDTDDKAQRELLSVWAQEHSMAVHDYGRYSICAPNNKEPA